MLNKMEKRGKPCVIILVITQGYNDFIKDYPSLFFMLLVEDCGGFGDNLFCTNHQRTPTEITHLPFLDNK